MNREMWLKCVFSFLTILMTILSTVQCYLYTAIHWDPLNPIFKTALNSKNKMTAHLPVRMLSQMYIICPNIAENPIKLNDSRRKSSLYENLWIVNKRAFESCKVNSSEPENRVLLSCDDPGNLKYRLLNFQVASPIYGEPEFMHKELYYFIATSNGSKDSLDNHADGRCKTHNMKLQIYICGGQGDPECSGLESDESQGTSSTPTIKDGSRSIDEETQEGKTEKQFKCFIPARDKIWLIAVGVVVGVLLVLTLGCLIVTCFKKKVSKPSYGGEEDGKMPLHENNASKRV